MSSITSSITCDNSSAIWAVHTTGNSNYDLHGNAVYYGNPVYFDDPYYWQVSPPVAVITKIVEVPAPELQKDRKEINDMFDRQTFLDALADEGKPLTSEEREIVRDAKLNKLELLTARLLARVFESKDLVMLKEKPKEVLVVREGRED